MDMDVISDQATKTPELEWGVESAELAYSVIARYVEHAQISGLVIALLASALGEERIKPIAQSEYWQGYMAGKRTLAEAKADIDRLTEMIERIRGREPSETIEK